MAKKAMVSLFGKEVGTPSKWVLLHFGKIFLTQTDDIQLEMNNDFSISKAVAVGDPATC